MFTSTNLIHVDTEAIYNMIYPLMAFENCKLSFEEFKRVIQGEDIEECKEEDLLLARNLQTACIYMFDTLNDQVNVEFAYQINEILTRGRITGEQKRDFEIGVEDLEYIQILRDCNYDLSNYDLTKVVPPIPSDSYLDGFMNVSKETYQSVISNLIWNQQEGFAYRCFMPMIRSQYFKKSNMITGALIVCKIVLRAKYHLMFIESKNRLDLAVALLDCIYSNSDLPFHKFVDIMVDHRVEMSAQNSVKVMIHY